jgi:hypothetical protein
MTPNVALYVDTQSSLYTVSLTAAQTSGGRDKNGRDTCFDDEILIQAVFGVKRAGGKS